MHCTKLSTNVLFGLLSILLVFFLFFSAAPQHATPPTSNHQDLTTPVITTNETTQITNTSATLTGYLLDDGGGPCSVWFEWDDYPLDSECAGLIATGTVCKDNRSIFWKNRHYPMNNQKPYFYQGDNYSYIGIGHDDGICRMGINEKGLAIGNFDIYGYIDLEKRWYHSDYATGSEDGDMHSVLGNFSTVRDAAYYLARHGTHASQLGIISAEQGVGAIVTIDSGGWTNITWVNNTWAALGNAIYCNGNADSKMLRVKEKVNDIIDNHTSSTNDSLIAWQDVVQRLAKDIDSGVGVQSEPLGYNGTYYASGINPSTARAAMVAVSGNESYNGTLNLMWVAFGQTTHLSLFVPLGASYVNTSDDIPQEFTQGNGLETYTDVKQSYAQAAPDQYYRSRVHDIFNYTMKCEKMTFDEYGTLLQTIMTCADTPEAKERLEQYADNAMHTALRAYEKNLTSYATHTPVLYASNGHHAVFVRLTNLLPGTVYYYKAFASNGFCTANGTQKSFMTRPNPPTDLVISLSPLKRVHLSWVKGDGAQWTIIERSCVSSKTSGARVRFYNGTGTSFTDTTVKPGNVYYYQLWSYTAAEGKQQYSKQFAADYVVISPTNDYNFFPEIV
jgi:hypothetical protein